MKISVKQLQTPIKEVTQSAVNDISERIIEIGSNNTIIN
jgi:hypothetical protein